MILRTNLWLLGLLLLLGQQRTLADDDFGESADNQSGDDLYAQAQLESAVEMEAQQRSNSLESDSSVPPQTENDLSMEQAQVTTLKPSGDEQVEHETAAEVVEDAATQRQETKVQQNSKDSQDYYYEMREELDAEQQTAKPTQALIPEYVRKAKAERLPQQQSQSNLQHENKDYVEDDEQLAEQQTELPDNSSAELPDKELQPVPLAQIQQLPVRSKPQPFQPSASDEFYYEEQSESGERKPTTTAATTPTTTSSTTTAPPTVPVVLQSRFGFPWSGSKAAAGVATSTTSTVAPSTLATAATTTPRKQSKHIHVPSPKPELLPADQLRNYIKDVYIRMPLAVIVDPSAGALDKAKRLYIDALQDKNINIKIVLVTLNTEGAPSAFSFNNTREFIAGLNSTKEHEGGNAFVGILHAAELVPYDSAVFISTDSIPPHTELVQDAAITLLKKRIRLFLLWFGERAASENETEEAVGGILGEVAIRSGGEIIHIISTEHGQHIAGNTLTLVADAYHGAEELDLPVDTTLSSLHVKIDAPMRRATLDTPNGEINLKKLVKFKSRTQSIDDPSNGNTHELDAYVPLNKLRKATTFKLKLLPEQIANKYNVFIRAERKADVFLGDIIKRFDSYYSNEHDPYPLRVNDNRLLGTSARMTALTHAKLQFPEKSKDVEQLQYEADAVASESPKTEVETFSETEVHREAIPNTNVNKTHLAAATYNNGNAQRSSFNDMLLQRCGTKVELGTQSQLLVSPGQTAELLFEVTNMRAERIYQNIQVTDERRFLVQLNPSRFYLQPRETAVVRLTVLVPQGTTQGTSDRITFTSYGPETTGLAVNLKVLSSIDAQDNTGPSLSWEFGNRCDYVAADSLNCGDRFWTLDIAAQDWQSGMLRLQTTPSEGLFYRNRYTAGTTEQLKATYMASCCEPRVSIVAYDAAGNQRSINIDVRDIVLTEAAIAAIVLGAILLLLLIVLLIASIVWCCRRRKVSLELPTYRSHSTRSME